MSNLNIMTNNYIDDATITLLSGTAEAQFPLTNIQKVFTTKTFRSTGTSCTIQIAFDSSQSIDTFMIKGNNLTGLGVSSCTIEFSPTSIFAGTSIETVDLSAEHSLGYKFFTEGSYRYAKIVLTGIGYIELSNLYLGKRTIFANNHIDLTSFTYSAQENYKSSSNNYGQVFIDKYNSVNTMSGSVKYINNEEFESFNYIYAEVEETTPLWVVLDEDNILSSDSTSKFTYSGYYYLSGAFQFTTVAPSLRDLTLNLIEVV